jgi:hypothetical protein
MPIESELRSDEGPVTADDCLYSDRSSNMPRSSICRLAMLTARNDLTAYSAPVIEVCRFLSKERDFQDRLSATHSDAAPFQWAGQPNHRIAWSAIGTLPHRTRLPRPLRCEKQKHWTRPLLTRTRLSGR